MTPVKARAVVSLSTSTRDCANRRGATGTCENVRPIKAVAIVGHVCVEARYVGAQMALVTQAPANTVNTIISAAL